MLNDFNFYNYNYVHGTAINRLLVLAKRLPPPPLCKSLHVVVIRMYFIIITIQRCKDWSTKMSIPTRFSTETTAVLQRGVPTQKARD